VQGTLEDALVRVLKRETSLSVAGRTDAGVHALGQVVSLEGVPEDLDLEELRTTLNRMCGPAVAVETAAYVPDDFNARFSARSRTYCYAILEGDTPDPFLARTCWHHLETLDVDAMNEGAGHLLGNHDFSSFGRVPEEGASSMRTLFELRAERSGRIVRITSRANAFIQQMVRSLVGTLAQVGEGKREAAEVPEILAARDRGAAGPVAPPHGLCLVSVEYDEGWSRPFDPF
jgi:tRNA pseudouridine38-40 synthase